MNINNQTVLGINRTQDASVCLIKGSQILCAIQKERLSGVKHDWGKVGDVSRFYRKLEVLKNKLDMVVECYSSDVEVRNRDEYHAELRRELLLAPKYKIVQVSHHLAHLYSTTAVSYPSNAAVLIVDFMGSPISDVVEDFPGKDQVSKQDVEVASVYSVEGGAVACIGKQTWNRDRDRPVGLGCFYYFLTQLLFPGEGNEGKVMGLAPYGDPNRLKMPPLSVEGYTVTIPGEWMSLFKQRDRFDYFQTGRGSFQLASDLAACGQTVFEGALVSLAKWLKRQTKAPTLFYAGGTALNCVANTKLRFDGGFDGVQIPPAPHDGGTAVGCAIYGVHLRQSPPPVIKWQSDFVGPAPDVGGIESRVESAGFTWTKPEDLYATAASLLAAGKVLGLYQGRSELGPRALGHRSILADPRDPAIREWINSQVKGREAFRPLAPVVEWCDCGEYFETEMESPFMQYAVRVKGGCQSVIPAVTHVDGTARLQTVTEGDDVFLTRLLREFKKLTGVGVLLNTSFNGKNEPIVESVEDALSMLARSPIHGLIVPPLVIEKTRRSTVLLGCSTLVTAEP